MHAALSPYGFTILAVALDESADEARPWVEEAEATYPVLLDRNHLIADAYGFLNVPTVVLIDGAARIAWPPRMAFPDDKFQSVHGIEAGPFLSRLQQWVKQDAVPGAPEEHAHDGPIIRTADERRARAHQSLALHLRRTGHTQAARTHYERAIALAPDDFTIWRAAMPLLGENPFGLEFLERYRAWQERGARGQVSDET